MLVRAGGVDRRKRTNRWGQATRPARPAAYVHDACVGSLTRGRRRGPGRGRRRCTAAKRSVVWTNTTNTSVPPLPVCQIRSHLQPPPPRVSRPFHLEVQLAEDAGVGAVNDQVQHGVLVHLLPRRTAEGAAGPRALQCCHGQPVVVVGPQVGAQGLAPPLLGLGLQRPAELVELEASVGMCACVRVCV